MDDMHGSVSLLPCTLLYFELSTGRGVDVDYKKQTGGSVIYMFPV